MTNSPRIQMKFRCDQELDKMVIGADGKPFCQMCQKSLTDFTHMPLSKVKEYTSQNEGCGIFKAEHVVPEEVILFSFASFRKYVLAFGAFLMAETVYSQTSSDSLKLTSEKVDSLNGQHKIGEVAIQKKKMDKKSGDNLEGNIQEKKERKYRYGVFFHRRFPFVSFRRRNIVLGVTSDFW